MASLDQIREDVRHLSLLGRYITLEVAVERQQQQAMRTDHPRNEVHH